MNTQIQKSLDLLDKFFEETPSEDIAKYVSTFNNENDYSPSWDEYMSSFNQLQYGLLFNEKLDIENFVMEDLPPPQNEYSFKKNSLEFFGAIFFSKIVP